MSQFIPNLRSAFGSRAGTAQLEAAIESKSLALPGYEGLTAIKGHSGILFTSSTRADSWDMERAVIEYERSVWAYRCIETFASNAAKLKYAAAIDRGTDDERRLDPRDPIHRVLNKRANPLEVSRAFKKRMSQQVHLSKKGVFVEVGKTRMGTLARLDLMLPDRVEIRKSDDGTYIKHFEYTTLMGELKELDPERVRWIREPHPYDSFSGTTPLEAAGLSVQMDMLSRLYNVSFIQNDSRPGGILAVNAEGLSEWEMNRLERKFKPGAGHAGELEVIASGPGGMNYVDTTTKPRDMNYGEAARNAKEEVLAAFGIGESVLGNASGRTFDNADAELYGFWTGPMDNHLDLMASGFDEDIDDEYDGFFDTSKVPALALPEVKAREEARIEVRDGLRSIDEYRPLAGLDKVGIAQTRALWVSPAKAPVPTDPKDAAALGLEPADGSAPVDGEAPEEGAQTAAAAVEAAREENATPAAGTAAEAVATARAAGVPDLDVEKPAALAVQEAREATTDPVGAAVDVPETPAEAVARARMEGKAATTEAPPVTFDVGPQAAANLELTVATVIEAMLSRQTGVITARVEAPKSRQGTRFWTAAYAGDQRAVADGELDAAKIVNAERWTDEQTATLGPVLMEAASQSTGQLYAELAAAGIIVSAAGAGFGTAAHAVSVRPVLEALTVAHDALTGFLGQVESVIRVEGRSAETAQDVAMKVREHYAARAGGFARSLATSLAGMTLNGATEAAVEDLTPAPGFVEDAMSVVKSWRGIPDAMIRDSHRAAIGQSVNVGNAFVVGGEHLLYPNDPEGSPAETRGCRCRLEYRFHSGLRFLLPPS